MRRPPARVAAREAFALTRQSRPSRRESPATGQARRRQPVTRTVTSQPIVRTANALADAKSREHFSEYGPVVGEAGLRRRAPDAATNRARRNSVRRRRSPLHRRNDPRGSAGAALSA